MSKITLTLIAVALMSVPAIPLATADETKADCEPGQQWAGYTTTDAARGLAESFIGANTLRPCEGEHWDGQDSVQPGKNPGNGVGCNKAQNSVNTNSIFLGSCMAPDPNNGGADPLAGNGQPVVFRVSYLNAGGNTQEAYVALDIALVGRAVVYNGECQKGDKGLEGSSTCSPAGSGQSRTGVYIRDNTPGEVLAQVISAAGVTKGHVSQGDCDQATYKAGANSGDREACGRDNTAITVDSVLP